MGLAKERRALTRRRFKEWEIVAVLLHQGVVIPCFRCKAPLQVPTGPNQVQREHIHELALGGPDIAVNCRFSHRACHAIVTNGRPATSAGSSKHRIAKANRMETLRAPDTDAAMIRRLKKRGPWPKGRKLQSRPFQKRLKP